MTYLHLKNRAVFWLMLGLPLPLLAAIAPPSTGNGELFLNVADATARVSFAHDLGLRLDDFFISGQPDGGTQIFYAIDNPVFTRFLSLVNPANLVWSVLAMDNVSASSTSGSDAINDFRLYTTVKQGDEARVATLTNTKLSTGVGLTAAEQFFDTVNSAVQFALPGQSTHITSDPASLNNYSINGSSYSLATDAGFGYFGKTRGLTSTLNTNTPFSNLNAVGRSSWFYFLTRSSTAPGGFVTVDEFDNGDGSNAGSGHDGYWGFTLVNDTSSAYNGKYLLSYTLDPRVFNFVAPIGAQREFAASIGRTEITSGQWVERLSGVAASATLEGSAGWVTALGAAGDGVGAGVGLGLDLGLGLGVTPTSLSAVPEPGTLTLWLAGAALLLGRRCRPAGRARSAPRAD